MIFRTYILHNGLFYIYITKQSVVIGDIIVLSNVTISGNSPHVMHLTICNTYLAVCLQKLIRIIQILLLKIKKLTAQINY